MVDDDVLLVTARLVTCRHSIVLVAGSVTHAAANEAHNHVVGVDVQGVVPQTDATARSCLAQNGTVVLRNLKVRLQCNRTSHVKDDDARAVSVDGCTAARSEPVPESLRFVT